MSWFPSIEEKTTFCFQVRIKQDASFYGQISPPRAENSDAAVATAGGAAATRNSSNAIRHQGGFMLIFDILDDILANSDWPQNYGWH